MANGKLLRQLIKSGAQGDESGFRAASEAVIAEEREKQHHLLANDLERLLYGDSSNTKKSHLRLVSQFPSNKDSGLDLLEERPAIREQNAIVLADSTQSAFDEIVQEHNRADVLRSFGLQPAKAFVFWTTWLW